MADDLATHNELGPYAHMTSISTTSHAAISATSDSGRVRRSSLLMTVMGQPQCLLPSFLPRIADLPKRRVNGSRSILFFPTLAR